jgi:hypothetical protein
MEDVVVTKIIFTQCRTVSVAVKVDTTHQNLKKNLEQVRLLTSPVSCVMCWLCVVSPHPAPKLEVHHLSAVHDCLFNTFAATVPIWRPSSPSAIGEMSYHYNKGPT